MKKLALFSDGTGNSGGAVNSNVWRLYEAVDRSPDLVPPQVTFYDDGVGTQENDTLRAISGGAGIGIQRNVTQLYAFLLQQYEPGDQIYLFGFSRGAFTARALSNLLFYCGIADARGLLPHEVDALATRAVAAYKKRRFCDPHQGPPAAFREACGLKHPANVGGKPGWFPLHCVGVWDTVEAYGLPVDEMADALSWLFPLRFQEEGRLCENDLHPLIVNAFHAIAIDDERHGFHPKLWIEAAPFDPATRRPLPGADRVMALGSTPANPNPAPSPNRVVRQVWFPGMHSNVGGGYAQDQLAHVSLVWMMEQVHAGGEGLIFDQSLWRQYQQAADDDGRMYDSRSGTGVYYRYRPRDLGVLCAEAGLVEPIIHRSAFDRIARHTQAYAPTGVPKRYSVEPAGASSGERDRDVRLAFHDYVDDVIWKRRVLYVVFVAGTLNFLGTLWYLSSQPVTTVPAADWAPITLFLYKLSQPLVKVGAWMIPDYFSAGWAELGRRPSWLYTLGALFVLCYKLSARWTTQIQTTSNKGWALSIGPGHGTIAKAPRSIVRSIRTSPLANGFAHWFQSWFAPKLLLLTLAVGTVVIVYRWFR
jgi:uncharacterized protein (DUF2235 family)